jgi:hypothetical protein
MATIDRDLLETRKRFRQELRLALSCGKNAGAKRKLVEGWRVKYSDLFYEELLSCAKSPDVCHAVSKWELE